MSMVLLLLLGTAAYGAFRGAAWYAALRMAQTRTVLLLPSRSLRHLCLLHLACSLALVALLLIHIDMIHTTAREAGKALTTRERTAAVLLYGLVDAGLMGIYQGWLVHFLPPFMGRLWHLPLASRVPARYARVIMEATVAIPVWGVFLLAQAGWRLAWPGIG